MAKIAKLKFKPTPIARLRKMNFPIKMVGDPPWDGYGKQAWANRERAVYEFEMERKWPVPWKPEIWKIAHSENDHIDYLLRHKWDKYEIAWEENGRPKVLDRDTYENKLRASGHEKIGGGLYANVFAKPGSDKVIKVANNTDGWLTYTKWAAENGYAGKFAPKVYSLKFKGDYYIAVMERLVDTMSNMRSEGRNSSQYKIYKGFDHWSDDKDALKEAADFEAFYKHLVDAGIKNDMHAGNVMVRKDGQVVVTDPYSNNHRSGKYRIKSGSLVN